MRCDGRHGGGGVDGEHGAAVGGGHAVHTHHVAEQQLDVLAADKINN